MNKNTRYGLLFATLVTTATLFFTGCASSSALKKTETISSEGDYILKDNDPYRRSLVTSAHKKLGTHISMNFKNTPVYVAVRRVAKKVGLKFDTTFAPSREYRVTASYKGTVDNFLNMVYHQSGVQYKYRHGLLTVFNKDYVDKEYRAKRCDDKGGEKIQIALRNIPPTKVFDYFIEKRGFDVTYDMKYYNVNSEEVAQSKGRRKSSGKKRLPKVSFFYKGCDEKEAIYKFAKANDLAINFTRKKSFTVRDYETVKLDVPTYFNLKFQSSGKGIGDEGDTGTTLSEEEDSRKEIKDLVSTYLSESGKAYLSNRGYLMVTDTPKTVSEIKMIIQKEVLAQQSMNLSVSIIRVTINDDYQGGVDWNLALREVGQSLGVRNLQLGLSYASQVEGGLSLSGLVNNKEQIIKVLSKYGKVKITRDYSVSTRSGILSTFKSVQKIPYVTTSVVMDGQTAITTAEAKEAEAGIVINLKPTLSRNNELVEFAIDATVSEYLGDKVFKVNGGDYVLPQLASNKIQMAASVPMNQTVILTGLRLKNAKSTGEGIPELSKVEHVGGLFGLDEENAEYSEFLLLLTPATAKRI